MSAHLVKNMMITNRLMVGMKQFFNENTCFRYLHTNCTATHTTNLSFGSTMKLQLPFSLQIVFASVEQLVVAVRERFIVGNPTPFILKTGKAFL